jgi:acyl carrier protein phosphodiesterase
LNFLAHILLSDHSPEIMMGNFIADFVRGNQFQYLPEGVIKGIKLHRAIDDFTDTHEIVKEDIKIFHPYFHRYSGIVVDIIYDYLLIENWSRFTDLNLNDFIQEFYGIVDANMDILPNQLKEVFPAMKANNWLLNYGNDEGLNRTFIGMEERIKKNAPLSEAILVFKNNYEVLNHDFKVFFPQLVDHVQHYRLMLS